MKYKVGDKVRIVNPDKTTQRLMRLRERSMNKTYTVRHVIKAVPVKKSLYALEPDYDGHCLYASELELYSDKCMMSKGERA